MSALEQLYQQIILDHSKHPHGVGLEVGEETSHQRNPVCGDEITLALRWNAAGDRVEAVASAGFSGAFSAVSGVSRYVARVKCAMLAWVAAEDLLTRRA